VGGTPAPDETVAPLGGCEGSPLAVVAQFLSLVPEQVQATARLLVAREEVTGPLRQEIARREQRIGELAGSGGDPAEIGRLVVEIHQLRQHLEAAQATVLHHFESLLSEGQRRKWRQVRVAARVAPVLPVFVALQLL
jgi:hypothetical protein